MTSTRRRPGADQPTGLLARARDAIPMYCQLTAVLDEIGQQITRARTAVVAEESVIDQAVPDVLAGDRVPTDLGERIVAVRRANERALAEQGALALLQTRLRTELRDAQVHGVDAGLYVLADELETITTDGRAALDQLGTVDSADDAIAADRTAAWTAANTVAGHYVHLRRAQGALLTAALEPADNVANVSGPPLTARRVAQDLLDRYGYIRDHQQWRAAGLHTAPDPAPGQLGERSVGSSTPDDVLPWITGDALTDLRFACRTDVTPWVPTLAELLAARDADTAAEPSEAHSLVLSPSRANVLAERGHLTSR